MKIKPWLSILIPPAVLALAFCWSQIPGIKYDYYTIGYVGNPRGFLIMLIIGFTTGLTIPLCGLFAYSGKLQIRDSAFIAGILLLAGSAIASFHAEKTGYGETIWLFVEIPQAVTVLGCLLLASSFERIGIGKIVLLKWKEFFVIVIICLVLYVFGVILNYIFQNTTWNSAPQYADPTLIRISTVRQGAALLLLAFVPLAVPISLQGSKAKTITRLYGVLLSMVTVLLLVGYIVFGVESIIAAPRRLLYPNNFLSASMIALFRLSPCLVYAIFIMAGLCLKLGFSRSPAASST